MPVPPLDLLKAAFGTVTWQRGATYHRAGRATVISSTGDGTHVEGVVTGTRSRPYRTTARLGVGPYGRPTLITDCTCPVGLKCKHAVALLLQAREDGVLRLAEQGPKAAPSSASAQPSAPRAANDTEALSSEVQDWLRTLEAAGERDSEDYPETVRQRLMYVVYEYVWPIGKREARVRTVSARLLKDGSFSTTVSPYDPANAHGAQGGAKFLRPSDRAILGRLARLRGGSMGVGDRSLVGEQGAAILEAILETGRARWGDLSGPVIVTGEPRPGRITWIVADDGRQRPAVAPHPDAGSLEPLAVLPVAPPVAIIADEDDPGLVIASPLTLALSPRRLAALLDAPALPADQIEPVRARLSKALGEDGMSAAPEMLPQPLAPPRTIKEPPVPGLRIFPLEVEQPTYWHRTRTGPARETLRLARPWFQYGPVAIDAAEPQTTVTRRDGDGLVRVQRSQSREREALKRLAGMGFTRAGNRYDVDVPLDQRNDLTLWPVEDQDDAWLAVLLDEIPRLRADGWTVDIAEDFPLRPVLIDGDFDAGLSEGGERVRALGRRLREVHGSAPAVTLPPAFTGTLRPYQAAGVARMQILREVELGGVLAGGVGLNLTAADTVIHYDPWWNPAVEQQATDRAHRIGQDKPVFVHRLIAEDSIEVKMQTLKDRKQALADGLYDPDGATAFDISEDDVEFLLGKGS